MLYFAYGSNMFTKRIQNRVSSANPITVGYISEHELHWHKVSKKDGSGKCDCFFTGNPDDKVYGVVFEIDTSQKAELDRFEGLGYGYDEKPVTVITDTGEVNAITYFATNTDASLQPYHCYKKLVLAGAYEHRLPADYIRKLENSPEAIDSNEERARKELSILE